MITINFNNVIQQAFISYQIFAVLEAFTRVPPHQHDKSCEIITANLSNQPASSILVYTISAASSHSLSSLCEHVMEIYWKIVTNILNSTNYKKSMEYGSTKYLEWMYQYKLIGSCILSFLNTETSQVVKATHHYCWCPGDSRSQGINRHGIPSLHSIMYCSCMRG